MDTHLNLSVKAAGLYNIHTNVFRSFSGLTLTSHSNDITITTLLTNRGNTGASITVLDVTFSTMLTGPSFFTATHILCAIADAAPIYSTRVSITRINHCLTSVTSVPHWACTACTVSCYIAKVFTSQQTIYKTYIIWRHCTLVYYLTGAIVSIVITNAVTCVSIGCRLTTPTVLARIVSSAYIGQITTSTVVIMDITRRAQQWANFWIQMVDLVN